MNATSPAAGTVPADQSRAPDIAERLIANGYRPVPCEGKRVKITDWTGREFTPQDFRPGHNVGIKTGQGVVLVDIDVIDPDASAAIAAEWRERHGGLQRTGLAPKTAFLVASDVKRKIDVKLTKLPKDSKGNPQKIEVLASGQQFVAYGIHPDTREPYQWHGLDPLDTFLGPAEMLPAVTEAEIDAFLSWVRARYVEPEKPLSQQALDAAGIPRTKPKAGQGGGFWRAVNDAALAALDLWVPALLPAAKRQATGAWRVSSRDLGREFEEDLSIHPDGIQDFGPEAPLTPIDLVKKHRGVELKDAAFWLCERIGADPAALGWAERPAGGSPARALAKDLDLVTDKTGRPFWNTANAVEILSQHPDWIGVLGFNEFTRRRVVLKPIPGTRSKTPRNLEDDDATAVLAWFNRNGFPKASAGVAVAAIHAVAARNTFDPLKDYLNGLRWDGQKRIDGWLTTYCGAEATSYTAEAGRRWLISAVARAMKPGCKADHMLVLEGDQGARKSSALAALAGDDWFSDGLPPMNTKDASHFLRGRWIVEVAELEAMRREMDAVKAFLSRMVETFTPKYGRETVDEPRRCVFAGTTNKDSWLKDETGGRRFWPVKVGQIDLDAIRRDRAQLWAEAVAAFKAGERWWLEGEAEVQARNQQGQRHADDPWLCDVMAAAAGRAEVCIPDILGHLGKLRSEWTRGDSDRVAAILKKQGWRRDGRVTSGTNKGQARYTPPK